MELEESVMSVDYTLAYTVKFIVLESETIKINKPKREIKYIAYLSQCAEHYNSPYFLLLHEILCTFQPSPFFFI